MVASLRAADLTLALRPRRLAPSVTPNVARVAVPDARLVALSRLAGSRRTVQTSLELHDIAGLIKGASRGAGLGNQFLGNIRQVSCIVHVVRCFFDPNIIHVAADDSGRTDPVEDLGVIETELLLSDLGAVEKRLGGKRRDASEEALLQRLQRSLEDGQGALAFLDSLPAEASRAELALRHDLRVNMLTAKPVLFVCNTDEAGVRAGGNELTAKVAAEVAKRTSEPPIVLCARMEEEALTLFETEEERAGYLAEFGLAEPGIAKVSAACSRLLNQTVFYTVGEQEARAWSIPLGATAQEAAGKIHSDIARGLIAANTIAYEDFLRCGGEAAAKREGLMRSEGRSYVVRPHDIIEFMHNT